MKDGGGPVELRCRPKKGHRRNLQGRGEKDGSKSSGCGTAVRLGEREERGRREEDTTKIEAGGGGGCREKEREWECDDSRPSGKRRAGDSGRRS